MTAPQMLENLRKEYRQRLPQRFNDLSACWDQLRNGQSIDVGTLHRMAHNLAGSAGSYGYTDIGQVAKQIEDALAGRDQLLSEEISAMTGLFESLHEEISTAIHAALPEESEFHTKMPAMTVLIADDDTASSRLIEALVRSMGHRTLLTTNGLEAVELFVRERPDLVLMDVLMPTMDGMEATRKIKMIAGDNFVPVIFLTGMTDNFSLVACLESGGDDFVPKPFTASVLKAKLLAMSRIRLLHADLARYRRETAAEIKHARHIMQAVTLPNVQLPWLQIWQESFGEFSGDVILVEKSANGAVYAFLGDMTGHGLAAALGAVPLADVFYDLAAADLGVGAIANKANQRLKALLPGEMFCAASILRFSPDLEELRVWSGGTPSMLLWHRDGNIEQVRSQHLALSILPPESFDAGETVIDIHDVRALVLMSDGFPEAMNAEGDMLGQQVLMDAIAASQGDLIASIREKAMAFVRTEGFGDDIALLAVNLKLARQHLDKKEST